MQIVFTIQKFDLYSSQCHIIGSTHIITFDGQKYQIFEENWYILNQGIDGLFKTFVKFQSCGDYVCPCALFGMENSNWIYFDHCHKSSLMIEHSEKTIISATRKNSTFVVSLTY